jgi:hypothetical protein
MDNNFKKCLDNFKELSVSLGKLMYRINCCFEVWKNSYGSTNYWKGLNSKTIDQRREDWKDVFTKSLKFYDDIKKQSSLIYKLTSGYQEVDNSFVGSFIKELDNNVSIINELTAELDSLDISNKEGIKELCDKISTISSFSFSVNMFAHKVYQNYVSLSSSPANNKEKEVIKNKSFKEQLENYVESQKKKESSSKYDSWVTNQYSFLKNAASPYNHLLNKDIAVGICELPVFLSNAYLDKANISRLKQIGYRISKMLGNYIIIENALLFGIRIEDLEDSTKFYQKWEDLVQQDLSSLSKADLISKHDLVPTGPLVKKINHYYSLLIPKEFISNINNRTFVLRDWGINVR